MGRKTRRQHGSHGTQSSWSCGLLLGLAVKTRFRNSRCLPIHALPRELHHESVRRNTCQAMASVGSWNMRTTLRTTELESVGDAEAYSSPMGPQSPSSNCLEFSTLVDACAASACLKLWNKKLKFVRKTAEDVTSPYCQNYYLRANICNSLLSQGHQGSCILCTSVQDFSKTDGLPCATQRRLSQAWRVSGGCLPIGAGQGFGSLDLSLSCLAVLEISATGVISCIASSLTRNSNQQTCCWGKPGAEDSLLQRASRIHTCMACFSHESAGCGQRQPPGPKSRSSSFQKGLSQAQLQWGMHSNL